MWHAPAGVNAFLSIAGDTVLVPAGLGNTPMLVALRPGAVGTIATPQLAQSAPAASAATAASTQLTIGTPARLRAPVSQTGWLAHAGHPVFCRQRC